VGGYLFGTALICFIYVYLYITPQFPIEILFSMLPPILDIYQVELGFDSTNKRFVGTSKSSITLKYEEVLRDNSGAIEPWENQLELQKTFIIDKTITSVTLDEDVDGTVRLDLLHNILLDNKEVGALFYLAEFTLPYSHMYDLRILVPDDFGLTHNLVGESRKTVLPNGEEGLSLRAKEVDHFGSDNVIRLKYPISLLRNPVLANIANFNGASVILTIQALICGALGFWLATAGEVIKDRTLRPATERLLTRIGLIRRGEDKGSMSKGKRKKRSQCLRSSHDRPLPSSLKI
jgi:hypothetical protein